MATRNLPAIAIHSIPSHSPLTAKMVLPLTRENLERLSHDRPTRPGHATSRRPKHRSHARSRRSLGGRSRGRSRPRGLLQRGIDTITILVRGPRPRARSEVRVPTVRREPRYVEELVDNATDLSSLMRFTGGDVPGWGGGRGGAQAGSGVPAPPAAAGGRGRHGEIPRGDRTVRASGRADAPTGGRIARSPARARPRVARECNVCTDQLESHGSKHKRLPTWECRHQRETCAECLRAMIKHAVEDPAADGTPRISCPTPGCGCVLQYEDVEFFAEARDFRR